MPFTTTPLEPGPIEPGSAGRRTFGGWTSAGIVVGPLVGGLLLIIVIGFAALGDAGSDFGRNLEFKEGITPFFAVLSGAGLAFYALIGFEDSVNIAEEVKDPSRRVPRAMVLTILVGGVSALFSFCGYVLAASCSKTSSGKRCSRSHSAACSHVQPYNGVMQLTGVFAPLPTPFDETGRLDLARLRGALPRWIASPLTGFVVLGTNGEAGLLVREAAVVDQQEREKRQEAERAAEHSAPCPPPASRSPP